MVLAMEKLNNLTPNEKIDYLTNLVAGIVETGDHKGENKNSSDTYNRAYLKRFLWLLLSVLLSFGVHWIVFQLNSAFYGVSLGFLFATLILLFVFVLDYLFIPGDTFDEKNNHSTLLFIIAGSIWIGILIGEGYTANSIYGEAKSAIQQVSDAPKQDVGVSGDKGVPNR